MILPPFFGSAIKSDDKSWEAIRSTYLGIDTLVFTIPDFTIRCTYLASDILSYNKESTKMHISYLGIDLLSYLLPSI